MAMDDSLQENQSPLSLDGNSSAGSYYQPVGGGDVPAEPAPVVPPQPAVPSEPTVASSTFAPVAPPVPPESVPQSVPSAPEPTKLAESSVVEQMQSINKSSKKNPLLKMALIVIPLIIIVGGVAYWWFMLRPAESNQTIPLTDVNNEAQDEAPPVADIVLPAPAFSASSQYQIYQDQFEETTVALPSPYEGDMNYALGEGGDIYFFAKVANLFTPEGKYLQAWMKNDQGEYIPIQQAQVNLESGEVVNYIASVAGEEATSFVLSLDTSLEATEPENIIAQMDREL
jgi:hypothetical protein